MGYPVARLHSPPRVYPSTAVDGKTVHRERSGGHACRSDALCTVREFPRNLGMAQPWPRGPHGTGSEAVCLRLGHVFFCFESKKAAIKMELLCFLSSSFCKL